MSEWNEHLEENEEQAKEEFEQANAHGFVAANPSRAMAFHTFQLTDSPLVLSLASRSTHLGLLVAIPLSIAAGLLIRKAGLELSFEVAAVLCILSIVRAFFIQVPVFFRRYWRPFAMIIICFLAAGLFRYRLPAAITAAIATLVIHSFKGRKPFDFYYQWLFAGPETPPGFWNKHSQRFASHPSYLRLSVFLAVIVIVPLLHSVTFALVLILLLALAFIASSIARGGVPLKNLRMAIIGSLNIEVRYLSYPDLDPDHYWRYSETQDQRRRNFGYLWMSLAFTLSISLSYCVPYEIFASWFQNDFVWTVPPSQSSRSFDWFTLPLALSLTAHHQYLWALVIGAVLSFVLPYLILFTIYLPALLRAQRKIEEMQKWRSKRLGKQAFQAYTDHFQNSSRVVETPSNLDI